MVEASPNRWLATTVPRMKSQPGTYAVVLRSCSQRKVVVGRWGDLEVVSGYYIYVGSAYGPGGVRARVSRHCRRSKRKHWHIDSLSEFLRPVEAWCSYHSVHLEHQWAKALASMARMSPIQRFGCSDCRCCSHLFFTARKPALAALFRVACGGVESTALSGC